MDSTKIGSRRQDIRKLRKNSTWLRRGPLSGPWIGSRFAFMGLSGMELSGMELSGMELSGMELSGMGLSRLRLAAKKISHQTIWQHGLGPVRGGSASPYFNPAR
ncbi:MAG: hypothetical protein O2967_19630 [Proteobacteria bacterium]|nr:hypothetical protein [Pseudomonadota bacterium]